MANKDIRITCLETTTFDELFPGTRISIKSLRKAEESQAGLIRQFHRSGHEQAKQLVSILEDCTPKKPCRSAVCPVCGNLIVNRRLRRSFLRFLRGQGKEQTLVMITIVLASAVAKIGALGQFSIPNLRRRLKYLFDKAGVGWVVGCLDFSVNLHKDARYEMHWNIHLHGFTVTDDIEDLHSRLTNIIPKTDAVRKPVYTAPWDGNKKAVRYTLKTSFRRRKGVDDAERFSVRTGKIRKSRATNKDRMLASERVELALYLHELGWPGRLFLRHVQLRRSPKGPKIVLINNHEKHS